MTLGLNPLPQILPALLIERRSVPVVIPAAVIQASIPAFSQSGTGMVRMWPPLPIMSAMTQCSSLCCMYSTRSAVNSARRSPQPSRIANVAQSRLLRRLVPFAVSNSCLPCSAVSQLPTGTPSRFAPFTRRMPAAKSALSRPQSAASQASLRTAARRKLIEVEA